MISMRYTKLRTLLTSSTMLYYLELVHPTCGTAMMKGSRKTLVLHSTLGISVSKQRSSSGVRKPCTGTSQTQQHSCHRKTKSIPSLVQLLPLQHAMLQHSKLQIIVMSYTLLQQTTEQLKSSRRSVKTRMHFCKSYKQTAREHRLRSSHQMMRSLTILSAQSQVPSSQSRHLSTTVHSQELTISYVHQ